MWVSPQSMSSRTVTLTTRRNKAVSQLRHRTVWIPRHRQAFPNHRHGSVTRHYNHPPSLHPSRGVLMAASLPGRLPSRHTMMNRTATATRRRWTMSGSKWVASPRLLPLLVRRLQPELRCRIKNRTDRQQLARQCTPAVSHLSSDVHPRQGLCWLPLGRPLAVLSTQRRPPLHQLVPPTPPVELVPAPPRRLPRTHTTPTGWHCLLSTPQVRCTTNASTCSPRSPWAR